VADDAGSYRPALSSIGDAMLDGLVSFGWHDGQQMLEHPAQPSP